MIIEWKPGNDEHNFGDHIGHLIGSIFFDHAWRNMSTTRERAYFLVGSVLCDWCVDACLRDEMNPYFVGCGYRGEPMASEHAARSVIYGCRGFLTKSALSSVGKVVEVIGDPAISIPLIVPAGAPNGLALLVPHVLDPKQGEFVLSSTGCDQELSAVTKSIDEVISVIKQISGAKFVLAGALHAAIIAYAYRVPFAFFEDGYVDCPPKWADWCTSIGLNMADVVFHANAKAGQEWYTHIASKLFWRPVTPILHELSKVGPIKHSLYDSARLFDESNCHQPHEDAASTKVFNLPSELMPQRNSGKSPMRTTNSDWDYDDQRSKLLALGVRNQDTSDLAAIVEAREGRKDEIVTRLGLNPRDHALELGSGMGYLARVIAPEVSRLHCADISREFLKDCRATTCDLDNIDYHLISYADLSPIQNSNIDKGYATLLFIHFNFYDFIYYLSEINSVLNQGGLFYFDYNDGERFQLSNKDDSFNEHVPLYRGSREHWIFECMHMTSKGTLENLVPQLGFEIVDNWNTSTAFSQMLLRKIGELPSDLHAALHR